MPTALFPMDAAPLRIAQAAVDDCYLSAALEEKAQLIIAKAAEQINTLNQPHKAQLAQCLQEIKEFPISFANQNSMQSIDAHQQRLLTQLASLLLNTQIDAALNALPMGELPEDILLSLGQTQIAIREAALVQKAKLLRQAEACITLYLTKIDEFTISFAVDSSDEAIKVRCKELGATLKQLLKQSDLVEALELISAGKERIKQAYHAKEQEINTFANQLQQSRSRQQKLDEVLDQGLNNFELASQAEAELILERGGFNHHLRIILIKTIALEDKQNNSETHQLAASTARTLYIKLDDAKTAFLLGIIVWTRHFKKASK